MNYEDIRPLVIGGCGNMGRRYVSIFSYLKIDCGVEDINTLMLPFNGAPTHYVVATPTNTHINLLEEICEFRKHWKLTPAKILIEKPVFTGDQKKVKDAVNTLCRLRDEGNDVYMVNNYAYYPFKDVDGKTIYDFYNSGGDGRAFDCIQLIHLARGEVNLSGRGPLWECQINGTRLNRERLDFCYVEMIQDFISDNKEFGKLWSYEDIFAAHKKVREYERSIDRNSSPFNID